MNAHYTNHDRRPYAKASAQHLQHNQHLLRSSHPERQRISSARLFAGESLGTFVFVYLGQASSASFEQLGTQNDAVGKQLAVVLSQALAFLLATFLTMSLSGAHLNPAFSLASGAFGYLAWARALLLTASQHLGAFLAAAFLHATYCDKLGQRHNEGLLVGSNATLRAHGHILSTGKLFTSYPPTEVSLSQLIVSNSLATAFLCLVQLAVQQSALVKRQPLAKPALMAASIALVHSAYAANGGPVVNPAQDFAPRLYIALFGWGSPAFNLYHGHYWWLCGLLAPHFGALIGFALYQLLGHMDNFEHSLELAAQSLANEHPTSAQTQPPTQIQHDTRTQTCT